MHITFHESGAWFFLYKHQSFIKNAVYKTNLDLKIPKLNDVNKWIVYIYIYNNYIYYSHGKSLR